MNSRQYILLNPGPVNIRPKVRKSLLLPDLCHREPEFSSLLKETRLNLLKTFGIEKHFTSAILTGSGTSALECAVTSAVKKDEKILIINNGVYGERISKIADIYGIKKVELKYRYDERPRYRDLKKMLAQDRKISVVAMVHHETSTGMLNPLNEIGIVVKKYKRTYLVDAISSLGGEVFDFQKSGADIIVGTSGKCLHGFPGLGFVLIRKVELPKLEKVERRSLYLDLIHTLSNQEKGDTPFTPSVPLFYGFNAALKELIKEGLPYRIKTYRERSELIHKTIKKLGLKFLIPEKYSSQCLVAVQLPEGFSYTALHNKLKQAGFVIYAGQSAFKNKIFRVSNLGDYPLSTIKFFCQVLEQIIRGKTVYKFGRQHDKTALALD